MTNKIEVTAEDKIIVTSLRPMSESPKNGDSILCCFKDGRITECYFDEDYGAWGLMNYESATDEELAGWLPIPQYHPKPNKDK